MHLKDQTEIRVTYKGEKSKAKRSYRALDNILLTFCWNCQLDFFYILNMNFNKFDKNSNIGPFLQ